VDHDGASELLGVYAIDACDESEAAEVRAHVSTCELCTREVAVLENLAGWLGASEAASPSAELRSRVLGEGRMHKDGE
jgi:anti-sigma factor ChrR (cupin superfamily)